MRSFMAYMLYERCGKFEEELQEAMLDLAIPVDEIAKEKGCLTTQ